MANLPKLAKELQNLLRLHTKIIGYKRLEQVEELETVKNLTRVEHFISFCQLPFLVRVNGLTIGITKDDPIIPRCMRLSGLKDASERGMEAEAAMLATTWFGSPDEAMKQQIDYPRIPVGEAVVLAPLCEGNIDPDVIMVYGNAAQIMMLMCGLQKEKYELFTFTFIGEGACSDSLGRCYLTGKPALSIPCYGERALGNVADDEILIALPPNDLERAISGYKKLAEKGLRYPINFAGPTLDPLPLLAQLYPDLSGKRKQKK